MALACVAITRSTDIIEAVWSSRGLRTSPDEVMLQIRMRRRTKALNSGWSLPYPTNMAVSRYLLKFDFSLMDLFQHDDDATSPRRARVLVSEAVAILYCGAFRKFKPSAIVDAFASLSSLSQISTGNHGSRSYIRLNADASGKRSPMPTDCATKLARESKRTQIP